MDNSQELSVRPPDTEATALHPDVIVLNRADLAEEPLWEKQPILTSGKAIPFP